MLEMAPSPLPGATASAIATTEEAVTHQRIETVADNPSVGYNTGAAGILKYSQETEARHTVAAR